MGADGVSVLATMQAGVTAMAARAPKEPKGTLTPLTAEQPGPSVLPKTPASFPNDMPAEVIAEKVRELDRIIAHLTESRDALALLIEAPTSEAAIAPTVKELEKAAEREADAAASKRERLAALAAEGEEGFGERMARLQTEAQAATFTQPEGPVSAPEDPDTGLTSPEPAASGDACPHGWSCPTHGGWKVKTSARRNRQYDGCAVEGCGEFERL